MLGCGVHSDEPQPACVFGLRGASIFEGRYQVTHLSSRQFRDYRPTNQCFTHAQVDTVTHIRVDVHGCGSCVLGMRICIHTCASMYIFVDVALWHQIMM